MSVYTFKSYISLCIQSNTAPTLIGALEVMEKLVIMHRGHLPVLQNQLIKLFSPTNILVQRKSMQLQNATYDLGIGM